MTVGVLAVNIVVVIDEVFVAGVIRGINVDNVDFALVGVGEGCQGFEVVALNQYMIWYFPVYPRFTPPKL